MSGIRASNLRTLLLITKKPKKVQAIKLYDQLTSNRSYLRLIFSSFNSAVLRYDILGVSTVIIQAEKFLNADWLKQAVFFSNTCHIWKRVVFQGLDFPYLEDSGINFKGWKYYSLEI